MSDEARDPHPFLNILWTQEELAMIETYRKVQEENCERYLKKLLPEFTDEQRDIIKSRFKLTYSSQVGYLFGRMLEPAYISTMFNIPSSEKPKLYENLMMVSPWELAEEPPIPFKVEFTPDQNPQPEDWS